MHSLGQYYNESRIFNNALYSILTSILGGIVFVAIVFAFIFTMVSSATTSTPRVFGAEFVILILGVVVGGFIISIVSALFARNAFNKLGEKSGVPSFNTAGLLYLLGGVLSIIGIGSLLIWIAWIFALIGFNSLKPKTQEPTPPPFPVPQQAATPTQRKLCPTAEQKTLQTHCTVPSAANHLQINKQHQVKIIRRIIILPVFNCVFS
jgi:uncharacterized membrane protein